MQAYPHMCRDGHVEIGHRDSDVSERCPLCRAYDALDYAASMVASDRDAATFQTLGQYRTALLTMFRTLNMELGRTNEPAA